MSLASNCVVSPVLSQIIPLTLGRTPSIIGLAARPRFIPGRLPILFFARDRVRSSCSRSASVRCFRRVLLASNSTGMRNLTECAKLNCWGIACLEIYRLTEQQYVARRVRLRVLLASKSSQFFHITDRTFTLGRTLSLTGSAARPRFIPGRLPFSFCVSSRSRSAIVRCLGRVLLASKYEGERNDDDAAVLCRLGTACLEIRR